MIVGADQICRHQAHCDIRLVGGRAGSAADGGAGDGGAGDERLHQAEYRLLQDNLQVNPPGSCKQLERT
ncbi:MAG: hypothetical protein ACREDY_25725, partial [Bradyrhizobium sp.]